MKLNHFAQASVILALCSAGLAQAAGPSASVTFSNLSFQVTDLDSTDGVAAGYALLPGTLASNMSLTADDGVQTLNAAYQGSTPVTSSTAPDVSTLQSTRGSAVTSWNGQSVTQSLTVNNGGATGDFTLEGNGQGPMFFGNGLLVKLAPNTSLVISADALVSAVIAQPTGCDIGLNASSNQACATNLQDARARASMSLEYLFDGTFDPSGFGSEYDELEVASSLTARTSVVPGTGQTNLIGFDLQQNAALSKTFQFQVANNTNLAQVAVLTLSGLTTAGGPSVYAAYVAPTPSVPEPGTWSLMALGGLGLAAAVRRRRASSSQV